MAQVTPQTKGKADGSVVAAEVKRQLSSSDQLTSRSTRFRPAQADASKPTSVARLQEGGEALPLAAWREDRRQRGVGAGLCWLLLLLLLAAAFCLASAFSWATTAGSRPLEYTA